jgi:hypothetical protein
LEEAKHLASGTGHANFYARRIGEQVRALDDEILPEIRAAIVSLEAEARS